MQKEENMENTLKLNTKRTIYIALGFFAVLMFWQVFNFYVPLILRVMLMDMGVENFNTIIGMIMSIDNLFALLFIPLIGILSDRTKTRIGKRMPYIICGVALTVLIFPFIPVLFMLGSGWGAFGGALAMMAIVLIAMSIVRTTAVALVPDVTPKPLRPKANAYVNFIGYIGAILAGGIAMIVHADLVKDQSALVLIPFIAVSLIMVLMIALLFRNVKENKVLAEMEAELELGEKMAETEAAKRPDRKLTRQDKINLAIILGSIFLWFFAFNAVETFWSTYGGYTDNLTGEVIGGVLGGGSLVGLAVIVLPVTSLITFPFVIWLNKKIGQKWSVIMGISLMLVPMSLLILATSLEGIQGFFVLLAFASCGAGWAMINVNSFPMVMNYANKNNKGKFTGIYYVASMSAQTLTTVIAGLFADYVFNDDWRFLFPYAAIFMAGALVLMLFYKRKQQTEVIAEEAKAATEEIDDEKFNF